MFERYPKGILEEQQWQLGECFRAYSARLQGCIALVSRAIVVFGTLREACVGKVCE